MRTFKKQNASGIEFLISFDENQEIESAQINGQEMTDAEFEKEIFSEFGDFSVLDFTNDAEEI